MINALIVCIVLSVAAIALLLMASPRFRSPRPQARLLTRALAVWLMAACVFSSYFYALQVPGLPDFSIERFVFLFCLMLAAVRVLRHDVTWRGKGLKMEVAMALFGTICIVSMSMHGFVETYSAFARPTFLFLNGYVIPFMAFVLAKYFLDTETDLLAFFKMFFYFGLYLAVIALMECLGLRNWVFPAYIVDPQITELHLDRARGPFLNSAFNGEALNIAFLCGLIVLPTVKGTAKRFLYWLLLLLYLPAIYYTRTRSVYLHFLLTLCALAFAYQTRLPRWKILPIVFFCAALVVAVNSGKLFSADREAGGIGQVKEIAIRLGLANKSIRLIEEHPFEGIGLAQFRTASLFTPADIEFQHNHLIGVTVELGLFGIGAYLLILSLLFARLFTLVDHIPREGFLNPNMVLLLGMTLIVNLVNNTFVEPTLHLFAGANFFLFAGIIDGLYSRFRDRPPNLAT